MSQQEQDMICIKMKLRLRYACLLESQCWCTRNRCLLSVQHALFNRGSFLKLTNLMLCLVVNLVVHSW